MLAAHLAEIDARIGQLWPVLLAKQDAFRQAHGHYFQGLWSHSAPPADGAEVAPDLADRSPGYQGVSWTDLEGLPPATLSRVRLDQYETAAGAGGFVLTVQTGWEGTVWERSIHHGVPGESYREQPWHQVSPE